MSLEQRIEIGHGLTWLMRKMYSLLQYMAKQQIPIKGNKILLVTISAVKIAIHIFVPEILMCP
jgi:hypothetical protein